MQQLISHPEKCRNGPNIKPRDCMHTIKNNSSCAATHIYIYIYTYIYMNQGNIYIYIHIYMLYMMKLQAVFQLRASSRGYSHNRLQAWSGTHAPVAQALTSRVVNEEPQKASPGKCVCLYLFLSRFSLSTYNMLYT